MKTVIGHFKFTVPEGHNDSGTEIVKEFEYQQVENDAEATHVIHDRKWNVVKMINDALKSNARSSGYQAALLPYKPSEVSPEDIKERMIRDYIRLGISEDIARKQVESLLSATV